jgi:hypothetical protein
MKPEFKEVKKQTRTYVYPPNVFESGPFELTIEDVVSINVSPRGTHRLNTEDGMKHLVLPGFVHIKFDAEEWSF